MQPKRLLSPLLFLLLVLTTVAPALAQSAAKDKAACEAPPKTFDVWLDCRVIEVATPIVNQREPSKQVEMPSIADNTTSLVDQTAAPDLVGLALNLAGLNSNDSGNDSGASGSITFSAYSLYAAALQHDPLDPAFYVKHPDLRRFSFTFGQDAADEKDPSLGRAQVFSGKFLILNRRDASLNRNRKKLAVVSDHLRNVAVDAANIAFEVQNYLMDQLGPSLGLQLGSMDTKANKVNFLNTHLNGDALQATLDRLTPKQLDEIKSIIARRIESKVVFTEVDHRTIGEIRRAPQLSLTLQTKQRDGKGTDEYRAGMLFDYGLYQRVNLSLNGTFDYSDSKVVGGDTRGGRLAGEAIFQLTPEKSLVGPSRPFLFHISSEAKWGTQNKPAYTGQLKLTIPLFDGIDFPVSVSFANRTGLIKESTVRGRFGFTLDLAKLLKRP